MPASKFKAATAGRVGKTGVSKAAPRPNAPRKSAANPHSMLPVPTQPAVDYATGEVVPMALVSHAVRYWWVLFLMITLGGLLGLLFSAFRPAQYEAVARFQGSIDYVSTGPLTEYEEDTAYDTIGGILISKEVMQLVVDTANAEGITIKDVAELHQMVSAERRFDKWDLRIRSANQAHAQRVAEIWTEQGHAVLLESYQHAIQAENIAKTIQALENCISRAVSSEPSGAVCSQSRFGDIQNDLREAGEQLYQERAASRSIFTGLMVGPANPVTVSAAPVLYGRNALILAGCLIGFLAGVLMLESNLLSRLLKRS